MKNKKLLLGIAGCALVTIMSCPAYAEDIKVVDGDGMEYTFTEPIKSAVVYDRYNTELFRAVGATDLMVGVDQNAVDTYPQYWDGVGKTLDIVGQNCTDFNVEKIVTLNPDAVFTSSLGEYENMREQLADFDIPVLVVNAWIPSEYYDYIQLVGDVTGNSEQAEEYIDFCKSAMETVTTGLENIPEEERKTVYFENNGENKTCLPGSGWNDMIVSAGGINIFGDIDYETADQTKGNTSAYEIDPEAILDANPDVIIDNIYSTKVHGELEAVVDLEEGELEDELASFGRNQMQKQLQLSDANYKNLVNDNYGISSPASRKVSASIYSELSKNSHSVVKSVMNAINSYYTYIYWTLLVLVLVVGLLPVVIALKIAKLFTDNFTKCPYCGKVFLSKKAKFGIISKLKFW